MWGREGGRTPEHYARALRCNTAGPFQICFLWPCQPTLPTGPKSTTTVLYVDSVPPQKELALSVFSSPGGMTASRDTD